jgi:hypothetical protein
MIIYEPTISGSTSVSGSLTLEGTLNVSTGITGSLNGTATNSLTSSYVNGGTF